MSMKQQHRVSRQLDIEELEGRVVPSASVSTNWSGYVIDAKGGTVTSVIGSWVVPAVSGTGTSYSSAWVGIDGDISNTVEQIGTDSDLTNGKPTYYAWYEMYPSDSVNLKLKIQAGDTITAQVSYGSKGFTLQIADGTQSYSVTKSGAGAARSSAEWIQEAPSSGYSTLPLSNFGTITFSDAQTTIAKTTGPIDNPAWSSQMQSINMVSNSGATVASTGGLTDSGSPATSSFSITYSATKSPAPTPPSQHSGGWGWSWYTWRQTNMAVTQPLSTLNGVPQFAQQIASPTATVQIGTTLLSAVAPLALSSSFGQGGQLPSGGFTSASSLVGGTAEQLLVLPPSPAVKEASPPDVAPAKPGPDALPLLPMPTPLDQAKETSTEARLWAPQPEREIDVIDQPEEERIAAASPTDLMFGFALAGAWGLAAERTAVERQLRSPDAGVRIRDVKWLIRGK
jgi:peptidase A4-like protein